MDKKYIRASEFQSDAGLGGERGKQSGFPRGVTGSDSDRQRGVSPYESNRESDYLGIGEVISEEELSDIMLKLQKNRCHNINLVTPTHFTPQIVKSLRYAIEKGLDIPVVWNCSGYENVDIIKLLDGIVDIYMPDIKYSESEPAKKYSNAPDYFERCKESIEEMYRQVGDLRINSSGIAEKGLLVRHLVLPDNLAGSEKVLKFIAGLSKDTYINIMDQYRPCGRAHLYPEINRRPTGEEFREVIKIARSLGLQRGFENKILHERKSTK
ncbi:MAG: radical SAM protein [Candidatus Omnitrophica bacterium]|nr:radical SAM protein [Candidatus Omnitrophota bacterium]